MAMDYFYKSYAETDLASVHHVTFIEPLAVFSMKALSFDSDDFTINSMKKVIEGNINELSYSSKNIF
jgi:predicted AAA+ superfamily ATPase